MALDLDMDTRLALVDELKKRIPSGEQKGIGMEVAEALGKASSTGVSSFSRLLNKDPRTLEQWLGPENAEKVLSVICRKLQLDMGELVRAARKAASQRPRPVPDRHPAWQELGAAAPWVEKVPGLPDGTEALSRAISVHGQRVVWLVGPTGSGKSARLWRAHEAKIGRLITDRIPDEAEPDTVWLVDEPPDPDAWIAAAVRCKARLVIATRVARQLPEGQSKLELSAWTSVEAESFLDQFGGALGAAGSGGSAREAVDLERIADKLAALGSGRTPLELGHLLRLLVDEPGLLELDENDRELNIQSAMHGMLRRAELSPDQERLWSERGRRALALAAAAAVRGASPGRPTRRPLGPIGEVTLREGLPELAGVTIGGEEGEPLRALLERARRESGKSGKSGEPTDKQVLQKLETWASSPSSDDLIELLITLGAWERTGDGTLAPTDEELALAFAAEHLDDDWMWHRLRDTLADREWSAARLAWAPRLGRVEERIDELLAIDAAVHVGAIELAVALVAFAREEPRPDQVTRAVCSAVHLLECQVLVLIGLSPSLALQDVVRSASRRYRRTLPPVTISLTREDLEVRCTENALRIVRAAERLTEDGPEWLRAHLISGRPGWVSYAELMPWQALPALQEGAGRHFLRFTRFDQESVLMDHAADGNAWARAVATGDVENIQETLELVSGRGLLRALGRWPAPCDPQRHAQALAIVLNGLSHENAAKRSSHHTEVVRAIVDFVRRHPAHPLPDFSWLRTHEASWREALDQAEAVHHLRAWFESERKELARAMVADPREPSYHQQTPSRLPPVIGDSIACLLWLGEALHRHGDPEPLRGLLEQVQSRPPFDRMDVAWELGVGAADALLRLRDAASLRSLRGPHGAARYEAVSSVLSRKSHDEETVLWIADQFGGRYDEVLESIIGRPERREVAKRWALDASSSFRRQAAAHWLLRHPAAGEGEHVRWLFAELPVEHSLHYVRPALAHPDEAIGAAAIALLPRVLGVLGANADLVFVARSFFAPRREDDDALFIMMGLERYLREVNDSRHLGSPDSIRALIDLTQRHLANASDEEVQRIASGVCSPLATAARRLRLATLAAWIREPLGVHADALVSSSRIEEVRAGIVSGISLPREDGTELELEVLQAVVDTADPMWAARAHFLLLEREALTEAQLLAEWSRVSDAVLVEREPAPARFYAVQDHLRRRDPGALARALADRLLALPPELRRFSVSQISQVAMLDAAQAARLSPLFD